MTATAAWAYVHLRRRWAAFLVVGVIAAVAGAATLAAVAGARRTASSYDRHREATRGPHALVATDFDPALWRTDALDPFLEHELVEDATVVLPFAMRPVGTDLYLIFDVTVLGAVDDRFGTELIRFRITEGRAYDHRRPDEAVITTDYAQRFGVGVGDVIRFESWTQRTLDDAIRSNFSQPTPDGPVVEVTVTGIAREFQQVVPTELPGSVYLTRAFTQRWSADIGVSLPFGFVRLERGSADFRAFEDAARATSARIGVPTLMQRPSAHTAQVAGSIDAQALALAVFALVAAAAGIVVTLAALARELSVGKDDQTALRALGMTRPERVGGVVMLGAVPALVAGVASAAGAFFASALVPIGTPGLIEPDPGVRGDAFVLAVGGVSVAAVVLVLAGAVGVSLTRVATPRVAVVRPGLGSVVSRWLSGSVPVSTGARMAFDRGSGGRALPTRTTLVGVVVGVAGAAAALAFAASLDHLSSTPRLYGVAADALLGAEGGVDEWRRLASRLEADADIAEIATAISVQLVVNDTSVAGLVVDPRRGDPVNVIVAGRTLQARDEVVVGREVANRLDVDVGDTVGIGLADGTTARYTVVGIAAHNNYGESYREQAAVLGDSLDPFETHDTGPWYGIAVTFRDGADPQPLLTRLRDEGVAAIATTETSAVPPAVSNVDEVKVFPLALAGLLGVLATTSLLHALVMATRRRGDDLAVLRALGLSSRQLRTIVVSHALTVVLVGLAVGLPLGLGIGRNAWASVAGNLGVVPEHVLPGRPVLWVAGVVVAAAVLGTAMGNRAVRARPAARLRAAHRE